MPKKSPRLPVRPAGPPVGTGTRIIGFLMKFAAGILCLLVLWVAWLDAEVTRSFEAHRWTLPARVHARPMDLYAGSPVTIDRVLDELRELGYRRTDFPAGPGEYAVSPDGRMLRLVTRGFTFPEGTVPAQQAAIRFSSSRVEELNAADRVLRLEPVVIGSIRPQQAEDRVLMRLADRPPLLLEALLAVEDRDFQRHFGISPQAILRAFFVNVSAGEIQQGGSTLTQQLVKNFFLGNERSLSRKVTEAVMAVLLEIHYDKNTLLETYCNEIFLGQAGQRAVHGFALASEYYFGRPVRELKAHEVALLVGLVKGPSYFNPWKHPERALQRRDLVLDALGQTGVMDARDVASAKQLPLGVVPVPQFRLNRYPAYMALVRSELRERLDERVLQSEGLSVFTALDPAAQHAAESAVSRGLSGLEARFAIAGLEAALLSLDPRTGEIEAAVGGRHFDYAGFNRATDARRSIGSLMKPVVYLEALSRPGQYSLASVVSDAPLEVRPREGAVWRPSNYDRQSHGEPPAHEVMLVDALAHSWNIASVRLGLELGVDSVLARVRDLGVEAELPSVPSVLLGSATLSPRDVLRMYQPLASGGLRVEPRAVRGVLAADGTPLVVPSTRTERVLSPATVFLSTWALQEVIGRGTARSAQGLLPPGLIVAGKTGTTDDGRDNWFAGYSGNHLAVVWIGRDDNRPTPLSGASGALPVWADFMARLPQVSLPEAAPAGVEWAWLLPGGGLIAPEGCAAARRVPVIAGTVPEGRAACDGGPLPAVEGIKGFFRRLFD